MCKADLISQENVSSIFYRNFQLLVGRGRKYSTASLAEATGIPQRTVEAHQQGESVPNLTHFLNYVTVMPEMFTNAILAPTGKGHITPLDVGEACHFTLSEFAAEFLKRFAHAMKDKHLDHQEQADLKQIAAKLRTECDKILQEG